MENRGFNIRVSSRLGEIALTLLTCTPIWAGNAPTTHAANEPPAATNPADKLPAPDLATLQFFPNIIDALPVKLVLPNDFVPKPLAPGMERITIWGVAATLDRLAADPRHNVGKIDSPVFVVQLSTSVAQTGASQFNNEDPAQFAAIGLKDVKMKKLAWGPYPVLVIAGSRPDGSPFSVAWVGMNRPEGWTIFLDYRCPHGAGHPSQGEQKIWDDLLNKTYLLPEPFLSRAKGFDRHKGYTAVNYAGVKCLIQGEQRGSDQQVAILIDPASSHDSFDEIGSALEPDASGKTIFWLTLRIHSNPSPNVTNVITVRVPLEPAPVKAFSLTGKKISGVQIDGKKMGEVYMKEP